MKKPWLVLVSAAVTLGAAVMSMAQTGNGAPSGPHYELGIIGVTDPKTQPLTGSDRHTIFVGLGANKKGGDVVTNIYLTQGPFTVCDGNGLPRPRLATAPRSPALVMAPFSSFPATR